MTIEQLYRDSTLDTKVGEKARALLAQLHWYSSIANFDPRTGEALPQSLSEVLSKLAHPKEPKTIQDRLWRIAEHARASLKKLFHRLNEAPQREHAILPLRSVHELDTASFMALSRRPGRNIREKLAEKPYMQAVRRIQTLDLPENRLLKAFAERLADLLDIKSLYLKEEPDELISIIQAWLVSDEARSIGRWENLSPNNTLLSHRDYRAVYDSWRWLQSLNEDIENDYANFDLHQNTMLHWLELGIMYAEKKHIFAEIPVIFNYETFEIHPWADPILYSPSSSQLERPEKTTVVADSFCIDLSELYPYYSIKNKDTGNIESYKYPNPLLWQRWKDNDNVETVDISLFNADAAFLHSDATTISSKDLFFNSEGTPELIDCAARAFVSQLRTSFSSRNGCLIWLQPDMLNDFQLEIVRRNINASFSNAEPLPRSIAAVIEKIDYAKLSDGYTVLVIDYGEGKCCATKLKAKYDETLAKRLPTTNGFYWERQPSIVFSQKADASLSQSDQYIQGISGFTTVSQNGKWSQNSRRETTPFMDEKTILQDKRIGKISSVIKISDSPVRGGIKLYHMQKLVNDIPLWRDQIPELSIKVINKGRYQRFYLVSKGVSIRPIRNQGVNINVNEEFTLPPGKMFYQFPLFIGDNEDEVGFSAKLESPAFPLKESLTCNLKMTFTYGADDPYRLVFVPQDSSCPDIIARWSKTTAEIITDAPAPAYPQAFTWENLIYYPSRKGGGTQDLLDWFCNAINKLAQMVEDSRRVSSCIDSYWREDRNGRHYTLVRTERGTIFLHENNLLPNFQYEDFNIGDYVSFEIAERNGRFTGLRIGKNTVEVESLTTLSKEQCILIKKYIHSSLYFPIIEIWKDGHSVSDEDCPTYFKRIFKDKQEVLDELLISQEIPQNLKNEFLFLLSCMHKDGTANSVDMINAQVENSITNIKSVGFALGDVTEYWQRYILEQLLEKRPKVYIRVLSYAIWRNKSFLDELSLDHLKNILDDLLVIMEKIKKYQSTNTPDDIIKGRGWARSVCEPLELLLGLLRTRSSSDNNKRMLLQPGQPITKKIANLVEHVAECVADSTVSLYSRVQLGALPEKVEGDNTPDLIYALRLYLTGDVGANAIQITGVSDGDDAD